MNSDGAGDEIFFMGELVPTLYDVLGHPSTGIDFFSCPTFLLSSSTIFPYLGNCVDKLTLIPELDSIHPRRLSIVEVSLLSIHVQTAMHNQQKRNIRGVRELK